MSNSISQLVPRDLERLSQLIPRNLEQLRAVLTALSANEHATAAGALLVGTAVLCKAYRLFAQAAANNFTRDTYDWRREIVVVTGGSGGLGDMLVRKLAKESVKVISLDIVPPRSLLPVNAYFYKMDATSSEDIKKTAAAIRKDHGHPTVLVNNAGAMFSKALLDESQEDVRCVFDINVISNFDLVREFIPNMIERNHGHVIHIASMASFVTGARNVSYAATKAAVLALHEGLSQELSNVYKAKKVRTSVVHPMYIKTPMLDDLLKAKSFKALLLEPPQVVDAIFKQILSGQSGQVFLPGFHTIASGVRGWPAWMQAVLRRSQREVFYTSKGW